MALAAFIISILALVVALMALPTVFQVFLGKPKLIIHFGVREVKGGKVLQGELYNPQIRSRLLQIVGIRRMVADDIVVRFSIKNGNDGSNAVAEIVPSLISHAGIAPAQRISLPPSIFPSQFGIATVEDAEGLVRVFEQDEILGLGLYHVFVEVAVECKTITAQRDFKVINKPPFAVWI
ncbi:MAG: hypothetical protein ABSB38_06600 [Dehalococcoidia bacterium]